MSYGYGSMSRRRTAFLVDRVEAGETEGLLEETTDVDAVEEYLDQISPEKYLEEERSNFIKSLSEKEREREIGKGIKLATWVILGLFSMAVILVALDFILIPLMLSWFLVYLIQPLVNLLVGKKKWPIIKKRIYLPRWAAVVISLIFILFLFVLIGIIIATTIQEVLERSDVYVDQFNKIYDELLDMAADFGYSSNDIESAVPGLNITGLAISVVSGLFGFLRAALFVLLFTVSMLLTYTDEEKTSLQKRVDKQVRAYLLVKVSMSAIAGAIVVIIYSSVGAPFAFVFALLTFLLNFIPNVGSMISYLLPIPVLLLDPDLEYWRTAVAVLVPVCIDMVTANVIEPKIMSKQMEIPALSVLISLMFWGGVWGIVGAILSLPITTTILTYLNSFDHPVTNLLTNTFVGEFEHIDPSRRPKNEK